MVEPGAAFYGRGMEALPRNATVTGHEDLIEDMARDARLCQWAGVIAAGLVVAFNDRDGASETSVRAWDIAEALEETRRHRRWLAQQAKEKTT